MNITQKSTGELTMQLVLNIVENDYFDEVKASLEKYRKQASIPGFRPGKVPFDMIRKMYGESVTADVISHVIGNELDKYLAENNISILGQPMPDRESQQPVDFKNEKDFTFFYNVGLKPEIKFDLDKSLDLTFYNIMADEEDVEKYVEDVRRQLGKQTDSDKVSEGDVISGSMHQVDENGAVIENGISIPKTTIHVDFIKLKAVKTKFLDAVVNAEIIFNPKKAFKNDTEVGSLLGIGTKKAKEIDSDFAFVIQEIKHMELAELNEDLYSKVYANSNIKTEEEFRAQIKTDIEKSFKSESERKFFNDAIEAIIKKTDLKLPDTFLKSWIIESNMQEPDERRIDPSEIDAQYDSYKDSLRWQLLEEYFVVNNNLGVTEQELREKVKELLGLQAFGGMGLEENSEILNQVADSVMKNKEEVKKISSQIIEQKLSSLFKDSIQPSELNLKYDDFVEMVTKDRK